LKRSVNRVLGRGGISVIRTPAPTLEGALKRLRHRAIPVATVIDVGASDGRWSRDMMAVYPQANYLLIEANAVHEPALKRFCAKRPRAQYAAAVAGPKRGTLFFDATDPFGGVASPERHDAGYVELAATSIDQEVHERSLPGPYLIKLDTHGFEVPILEGARVTLANAELLIVECYNFRIAPEARLFHEMCAWLGDRGFRCIDVFDLLYRPRDESFWQADIVFARESRPEFRSADCT
jgi:FkbM family methyltransferase